MRHLSWDGVRADSHVDPQLPGRDQYDARETDPPEPLQIVTRLGVLLMIALAFALAAKLLAQLPLH